MTKYCGTTPTAELNTLEKGINLCPSLPTSYRFGRNVLFSLPPPKKVLRIEFLPDVLKFVVRIAFIFKTATVNYLLVQDC